ncbi:hypothetical protein [Roseateles amylovorans]|uniref:Uncharacterized protein n=1 Tax=Roseateles amylovorans TaxID=2978473 RepID=A0ABY6B3C9_9BURK|nr:hypothetical protein [Roseateles amylovorans]UXH79428.1 hypothetical protein N4261_05725 [Roseateles amylovorans]
MGPYVTLLRIDVAHGYFADGRCRGLRFVPTPDTADRLRRADTIVREDGATLLILGAGDSSRQYLCEDPDGVPLTWQVYGTDSAFAYYTDDTAQRPGELLLLDAGTATPDDADAARHLQLSARPVALNDPRVAPSLHGAARLRPPFALLSLPLQTLAAPAPLQLRWSLAARATVWKYCLFGEWAETALEVIDLAGTTAFTAPQDDRLDDGRPMLAVRSREPIALAQRASSRFQLRCRNGAGPKVLIKRLPVAAALQLGREEIDGVPTLISEIHVHR